ncbi:hypothetical protein LTR78_003027 [Recurvomyces mirabilis]|uniref:F-box domain-containing protein n=1 Tax=Recurvomyces mirabilis TaxID=574656 RepID=A0AAE0WS41_9PEZI|nr:hypothetical protein LTR78_003027 [Recurvomyces mirabilis]KAK5157152.1 hypothetical protein LTS14_004670 [Recurvomyces mirabilis]
MESASCPLERLPSEILTMLFRNLDSIFDLQNIMLASPHVWRHLENDRQVSSILDELLQKDSIHRQLAFAVRTVAYLRHQSPQLIGQLNDLGLDVFEPGFNRPISNLPAEEELFDTLPESMEPVEVRSLLTTSGAIHATASRCINCYLSHFHALRPVRSRDGVKFDVRNDSWDDLPTGPRFLVPYTGAPLWTEFQQLLKAFWMLQFANLFFLHHKHRSFDIPEDCRDMEIDDMKPIDLFGFERQGRQEYHSRNRPRDYLFHMMQLFITAEEYLADVKRGADKHPDSELLSCEQGVGDAQMWPDVSETMEHFVRLFKDIRSLENGDGFSPWRRLGFAIWDIARLRKAGLVHHPERDRDVDRVRWLSVIREDEFPRVQNHRQQKKEGYVYYPEDSDESSKSRPYGNSVYWLHDNPRRSLALEFDKQAHDT